MRITVVTHYFAAHGGGIEKVAERLCDDLATHHGFEIDWFGSKTESQEPSASAAVTLHPMACCNAIEQLTGLPYPLWSPRGLMALSRAIAHSDAVQVHDFSYPSSIFGALLARLHGTPLLLTQHTGAVRTGSRLFGALYGLMERTLGRWMFASAVAITCVSETTRAHWQPRVRNGTKLITVWNGLDIDESNPPDETARRCLRADWSVENDRPVVLFVGRRIRKKGINIVRGVAAALPHVQFLIAGRGPCDPDNWRLPNVRALGYVDEYRIRQLYDLSDVLFLPSYAEGFPLVVQEALGRGIAILSTDEVAAACPPIADLVSTCPVPRNDEPEPWISALATLVSKHHPLDERDKRRARVHALWSREAVAARYAEILDRIRKRPGRAHGSPVT